MIKSASTSMQISHINSSLRRITSRYSYPALLQRKSFSSNNNSSNINSNTRSASGLTLFNSLSNSYKSVPLTISSRNHNDQGQDLELKSKSAPPAAADDLKLSTPKGLAWYTCGPTVYDSAHLGHARTYVSLDIIQRCLLHMHKLQLQLQQQSQQQDQQSQSQAPSPPPIFIMNITDVDDKILARAKERNVPALELAQTYEREFWQDMQSLNVMRPTIITRVTDHVECSIIPYIDKIEKGGMAYRLDDGVYFDVAKFEEKSGARSSRSINKYGKLAPGRDDTIFSWNDETNNELNVNSNERRNRKKDPRDFVLWKNKQNENEELAWDSPFGVGRPGWHIECSAMIDATMQSDALKDNYRMYVHAGGVDLKFPHHTNEIAQAEAYMLATREGDGDGGAVKMEEEWIPHWVHTGHLHIDGLKMSKSLKNFITIRDVLKTNAEDVSNGHGQATSSLDCPADDFRLWCLGLSGSYRGPATYSKSRLEEARVTRQKILRFLVDGEQWLNGIKSNNETSTSSWCAEENNMMEASTRCQAECQRALLGLSSVQDENKNFDLDGAAYLGAIVDLSEAGNKYISGMQSSGRFPPIYAVEQSLDSLRDCLSIVGFSDQTTRAGLAEKSNDNILGGNEALTEELVEFRSTIRALALSEIKGEGSGKGKRLAKDVLSLCDTLRDETLPTIGLEIYDRDIFPKWRFAMPRSAKSDSDVVKESFQQTLPKNDVEVTISNFFQTGRYTNEFSASDEEGFPTHNADGAELSKRLIGKLTKKRAAFFSKNK
jgi:cysteinyl-tRNA synthetase